MKLSNIGQDKGTKMTIFSIFYLFHNSRWKVKTI